MKTPVQHHQEREWKYSLPTRAEFQRLLDFLGPQAPLLRQTNHYWLPALPLRSVLRLRLEDGRHLLTLKGPSQRQGALFTRGEAQVELPGAVALDLLGGCLEGVRGSLEALGVSAPLTYVGSLVNERRVWLREGFEIALDESFFPRGPQLEIEFEQLSEDSDPALPAALLAACGVEPLPSLRGKFSRLKEELGSSR
jgi:uncharacterized protein YjbK